MIHNYTKLKQYSDRPTHDKTRVKDKITETCSQSRHSARQSNSLIAHVCITENKTNILHFSDFYMHAYCIF